MPLRLEPLDATNAAAANSLTLKRGQEQYLIPVTYAAAEHTVTQTGAWSRVVRDGDEVVGFITGHLDADEPREEFRSCLWKMNVKANQQGHGIGRFAVDALADEARSRGFDRLTVVWERGDEGPEQFFLHVGFRPVGETAYGEVLGAMALAEPADRA